MSRHEFTPEESRRGALAAATVKRERRARFEESLAARLDEHLDEVIAVLVDALRAEAHGVDSDGNIVVLGAAHATRIKAALAYMHEVYGRPTQRIEVTGEAGGPITHEHKGKLTLGDVMQLADSLGVNGSS